MRIRGLFLAVSCWLFASAGFAAEYVSVKVDPTSVSLEGPSASYSLLVDGQTRDGRLIDLTHEAHYRSADANIAEVSPTGVVRAKGDGQTTIEVEAGGRTIRVPVRIQRTGQSRHVTYSGDVLPILSRFGCNASACHGKAEGQNGFKLSVFGFDPAADHAALVKEARGRRLFPAAPELSLLLRKMSGQMPHGGGAKVPRTSGDYETVRAWIAAGAPLGSSDDPVVQSVRVEPAERLLQTHQGQQLRVMARYGDGRQVDVTALSRFQSNNEGLVAVQPSGLILASDVPGEAAIMASFMNEIAICRVIVPRSETIAQYPALPENNFIDRLVNARLRKLNILPSEPADDSEYLRRLYLDLIGTLPTAEEARRFLKDQRTDKRARLVEELLDRPEFADFWALQWADLLRVDRGVLGHKRAYAYYRWIRESIAANMPLDRFAREVLTAEGPLQEGGPAAFYRVVSKPGEMASTLSQVFLGVRIGCAECHHHPYDRWSQDDYYGMQAYFTGVAIRPGLRGEALFAEGQATARNPRSGQTIPALPLGEETPAIKPPATSLGDARVALAEWLTRPDNPYFARNVANRTWAHLLGRGLVEPVDDVRATNPPTNPELLEALARHLVESKFDLRALIRTIVASRTYQLSSRPNATNESDEQNASRALFKRVSAEVLCDMVGQVTGVPERFPGVAPGTRAIQLWDSKVPHYFLKVFGRPERLSACECERNHEPSVAQVLHLLNAPEIQSRLSHEGGLIARMVKNCPEDRDLIEEMYLTYFGRFPTDRERQRAMGHLQKNVDRRRQATEDLAWVMMNSLEFVFNH